MEDTKQNSGIENNGGVPPVIKDLTQSQIENGEAKDKIVEGVENKAAENSEFKVGTDNVIPVAEVKKDVLPEAPKMYPVYDYKGNVVDNMTEEQIENADKDADGKRYIPIMKEGSEEIAAFNRKRRFIFNVALPVIKPAIVADTPEEAFQILSKLTIQPYISRANVAIISQD